MHPYYKTHAQEQYVPITVDIEEVTRRGDKIREIVRTRRILEAS